MWLTAAELFDSNDELSVNGRWALDQAMSDLVSYLPNNPMMIEGYSKKAAADQSYLSSRRCASEVRQHLESRFQPNPKPVGIMPLDDHPPRGAGKETWDGVCLVLVVSKQ